MGRGLLLLLEANHQHNLFSYLRSDLAVSNGPMCSVAVAIAKFEAEVPMCLVVDKVLFPLG